MMLASTPSHLHTDMPPFRTLSSSPLVQCTFVMPGCDHDAVFHDEYLRTNRTNHTKIMRCFPHCCPGHRARSYCGSPLHVKLQSQSPHYDSQLVVFGRFRPAHIAPLNIGDRVQLKSIMTSLQSANPSTGEWIESRLSRFHDEPLLYEINPSGRWYYPWSGAATIAMRSTEHVFEAVVFYYVTGSELEVVAQTASPNFGLKSFRRSAAPTAAAKDDVVSPKAGLKRKAVTRAASPTDGVSSVARPPVPQRSFSPELQQPSLSTHSTVLSPLRTQFPLEPTQAEFVGRADDRLRTHGQAFPMIGFPAPNAFLAAPPPQPRAETLQTRQSPLPRVSIDNTLWTLTRWLHELPASSVGSRSMLHWQEMVQAACEAQVIASREVPTVRTGLVPILSALDIEMTKQSSMRQSPSSSSSSTSSSFVAPMAHTGAAGSPLDTMDAAVRVLLHEWLDVDSTRASTASIKRLVRNGLTPQREELAAAHGEWLSDATARAQRYVHANAKASWFQLMTTTSRLAQQSQPSSESEAGSEFSYRSFAAKYREQFIQQPQRPSHHLPHLHKRQRSSAYASRTVPVGLLNSSPVWTSRMEDVSIELGQQSLSLLTVVQFWKHLSCLRLDFSPASSPPGPPAQLSVASVFNSLVSEGSFTKLTLDGQYRWFNCLPSGEPTVGTTLMGYVVGDYVGRATSAGTIHITAYLWPATAENATAFAWHWTIDAASLTSGSTSSVVNVVVESASVGRSLHAMETMSMAEKLRCVGRWQHACVVRVEYRNGDAGW